MVQLARKLAPQLLRTVRGRVTNSLGELMQPKRTVPRTCQQCFAPFMAATGDVNRGAAKFCSRGCASEAQKVDPVAAFWAKVDKRGPDECWPWMGARSESGYGLFAVRKQHTSAHRFSLELKLGRSIKPGMYALHSCPGGDNKWCANPTHLREGSALDNSADARERGQIPTGDRSGARTKPERRVRGSQVNTSRLTTDQVRDIRQRYIPRKVTTTQLAEEYGISHASVSAIIRRKTWKHVA